MRYEPGDKRSLDLEIFLEREKSLELEVEKLGKTSEQIQKGKMTAIAQNDYNLTPNRVLRKAVRKAGQPVESKVYPAFGTGPRDGHSFGVRGMKIWGPDVLSFIETYLQ